jgi:predicted XRE-type DNA-binding protein
LSSSVWRARKKAGNHDHTSARRHAAQARRQEHPLTESTGNVFADIGLPEPEQELTKAQLASHIRRILKRRRLTQAAAAELMGIDQPKVSALLNGRLANFSSERLMRLLTALGHDVQIAVSPDPNPDAHGRISVVAAAE